MLRTGLRWYWRTPPEARIRDFAAHRCWRAISITTLVIPTAVIAVALVHRSLGGTTCVRTILEAALVYLVPFVVTTSAWAEAGHRLRAGRSARSTETEFPKAEVAAARVWVTKVNLLVAASVLAIIGHNGGLDCPVARAARFGALASVLMLLGIPLYRIYWEKER